MNPAISVVNIRHQVPLAPLTTFGVGGHASHFCTARTVDDVLDARRYAAEQGLSILTLGGGSNLLISDTGVRALVLKTELGDTITDYGDGLVSVSAGAHWDDVCAWSTGRGLAGIECLSGVPGRAGAACVQNIGAYGQQIGDSIEYIEALDLQTGEMVRLDRAACRFGYRTSLFNTTGAGRYVILGLWLRLRTDGLATLSYADVSSRLPAGATLKDVRGVVLDARASKGMIEGMHRSAGSFFKNPVITGQPPSGMRAWPLADGRHKLSAAALIEGAGMVRGHRHGNAGISPEHALALVAHPGAGATDIIGLARTLQERVNGRFGIVLEPEVQLWGFDEYPLMR